MVRDALEHEEEKGTSPRADESWMKALKEASGTVFSCGCSATSQNRTLMRAIQLTAASETVREQQW